MSDKTISLCPERKYPAPEPLVAMSKAQHAALAELEEYLCRTVAKVYDGSGKSAAVRELSTLAAVTSPTDFHAQQIIRRALEEVLAGPDGPIEAFLRRIVPEGEIDPARVALWLLGVAALGTVANFFI